MYKQSLLIGICALSLGATSMAAAEKSLTALDPISLTTQEKDKTYLTNPRTIWLLSDLSYEMPSNSNMTYEYGFGFYGVGGGINLYTNSNKQGLMYGARAGLWGGGFAVNAQAYYVGQFSEDWAWRVGAGLQYMQASNWYRNDGLFPIITASVGFRF